ncbi:MAG: glycosyltransferase family 2 protein [Mycobacteriaceae bacterium]
MTSSGPLAVVVVTYSPGAHLEAFLAGLEAATRHHPVVVLADNGSTDGAPEAACTRHRNVRLLPMGENLGYGSAVNRAVAELDAEVEWVLVSNPDVVLAPGSVDELLAVAARWPRAGAVGPLVREPDGTVYPSAREVPDLITGTGHALLARAWPSNPFSAAYRRSTEAPVERTAGWLSGSCLLLRRQALASVGGFDSRYFMYFEDVDLGDRLARAGWLNVYAPSAEVVHAQGHAADRAAGAMLAAHHASAYRFTAQRHPGLRGLPLRAGLRSGLALRRWWGARRTGRSGAVRHRDDLGGVGVG